MSDPILCPSCKNPINQHTLQGMRLTIDTWCTYRPQDIAADLEAKLKTKERDTEHLLELGKQITAIASERDRLREAAILLMTQYDSLDDFVMGGNLTNEPFLMFRAALDNGGRIE